MNIKLKVLRIFSRNKYFHGKIIDIILVFIDNYLKFVLHSFITWYGYMVLLPGNFEA